MENFDNEIWKDIEGYFGKYQISNYGRVKSLERVVKKVRYGKTFFSKINETVVKCSLDKYGYYKVGLWINGKSKRCFVHRLVAEAFIPNPDNLPQVNHKDEIKTNNFVWVNDDGSVDFGKSNLEWCSASYNTNYGNRNKTVSIKNSKPVLQLSKDFVVVKKFDSLIDVENQLGFMHQNISKCCKGKIPTAYGYIWRYADYC